MLHRLKRPCPHQPENYLARATPRDTITAVATPHPHPMRKKRKDRKAISTIAVVSFILLVIYASQDDRREKIEDWFRTLTLEKVLSGAYYYTAYIKAIELHGKVVDQNGHPVPGAKVEITLGNGTWRTVEQEKSLSDKGEFQIKGGRAAVLRIRVTKEGYGPMAFASVGYLAGASGQRYRDPQTPLIMTLPRLQTP